MALGRILRDARMKRGETVAAVAAATQIMVQTVEDLEAENFSRISVPIYVKGFIKLYARHLGIDPQPLVDDYMAHFANGERPSINQSKMGRESHPRRVEAVPVEKPAARTDSDDGPDDGANKMPDWLQNFLDGLDRVGQEIASSCSKGVRRIRERNPNIHDDLKKQKFSFSNQPTRLLLKYVPVVLGVVLILLFLVSSISRGCKHAAEPMTPRSESTEELRLVIDPPPLYLDDNGGSTNKQ